TESLHTAFVDYKKTLENIGSRTAWINKLNEFYQRGETNITMPSGVTLIVEMVPVFYKTHGQWAIMPMHDTVEWFLAGVQKAGHSEFKNFKPHQQSAIIWSTNSRGTSAYSDKYPTYTYIANARASFAPAVRPRSSQIPLPSNP